MHTLGEPTPTRIIAEGFSTGVSIHEATGHCVHIAFFCHNLKSVAESIRKAHPDTDLIIAADDDWKTEENSGMANAIDAAKSSGGRLAVPTWLDNQRGKKETDFNDLALSHGQARVKTCINRAAPPEKEEESAEGLQASIKCLSTDFSHMIDPHDSLRLLFFISTELFVFRRGIRVVMKHI